MAYALLMFHIDLEVAYHHHAAKSANTFFAAAELPGFHVALHDVHTVLLIEGDAGDFVEANHVVLADQAALAIALLTNIFATVALPPETR